MGAVTRTTNTLAYDDEGTRTPVVFLHGLTFDRRSWRPIVERLEGAVRSIAIDLPAHGESGGTPAPLEEVAAQMHELLHPLARSSGPLWSGIRCRPASPSSTRPPTRPAGRS